MKPLAIALLLLLPAKVVAQSGKGDWARVQSLAAGSRVRVVELGRTTSAGSVVTVSSDSLTMTVKGKPRTIPIEKVVRIQKRSVRDRLVLGAIFVPIGVLVGGLLCPECTQYGDQRFVLTGAALGAATMINPVYVTIYEIRQP